MKREAEKIGQNGDRMKPIRWQNSLAYENEQQQQQTDQNVK